jgi:site-specific recombinase XerD
MSPSQHKDVQWDYDWFVETANDGAKQWRWRSCEEGRMRPRIVELARTLNGLTGTTVQERWEQFETATWPQWLAGRARSGGDLWRFGTWAAVLTRIVRPSWSFMSTGRVGQLSSRLPATHAVRVASDRLRQLLSKIAWVDERARERARVIGLRVLLVHQLDRIEEITEAHLLVTGQAKGMDALDGALCAAGIFDRAPSRGTTRWSRRGRLSAAEMVDRAKIPARFREVTIRYLDECAARLVPAYGTLRSKAIALGHWWTYVATVHADVGACRDVRARHARGFIEWAKDRARKGKRRASHGDNTFERGTAHVWVQQVRLFFADLSCWSADEDAPLAGMAPPLSPLGRHDLTSLEPGKIRKQTQARMTITVLELERELPKIRAFALRRWHEARLAKKPTERGRRLGEETSTFWDWALLELLVQSGLRIEEACELTTLDVLRRQLPDGRRYYLLHVKPSKFDRARVVPIGDGLGRTIAEIVRHARAFYGLESIPPVRAWDSHEKRWRPSAPYLLQTVTGHPSVVDDNTIRARLAGLSRAAGAQRSDGRPLVLLPHDCRRMFASEHLNNATPPHVIQALLGHATIDTVLVYAKLYPTTLVEEYRKTLHSVYRAYGGDEAFKNPTREEWAALNQACSVRDMGTHLCALPTGDHCPKGLVCLGCGHAQPKKSAAPIFRSMLASHNRALEQGRKHGEPAGQLAARELEVARIQSALRRADELTGDVAIAIEASAATEHSASDSASIASMPVASSGAPSAFSA